MGELSFPNQWGKNDNVKLSKYNDNSKMGPVDGKRVLDYSDDAARIYWGSSWRMPTEMEWTELEDNCTWTWISQNGVYGALITSKANNNSIFLPGASGHDYIYGAIYCHYWSSSLRGGDASGGAWDVLFDLNNQVGASGWGERWYGLSVRPVSE